MQGPTEPGTNTEAATIKYQTQNERNDTALEAADGSEAVGEAGDGSQLADGQERRQQSSRGTTAGRNRRRGWSASEMATLSLLHAVYGNKWSVIARHFRNRHDGDVKNMFHSALRSKPSEVNCLLRAYAQAVGPNCDDPRARQTAYEAARQQYGSAPVLSSAAPYMHLPTLCLTEDNKGVGEGLEIRGSLRSIEESSPSVDASADAGLTEQRKQGWQAGQQGDGQQQQHGLQRRERQKQEPEEDDLAGLADAAGPSEPAAPDPAQTAGTRCSRVRSSVGPAQADTTDRGAKAGGSIVPYSPSCDVLLQPRSDSLSAGASEPASRSWLLGNAAAELGPVELFEVPHLPPPLPQRSGAAAGWSQRCAAPLTTTGPTPPELHPAPMMQQQQQEPRPLSQQPLHQHHRFQGQWQEMLQPPPHQQQQRQEQPQQLIPNSPSSVPQPPLLCYYSTAVTQQQPQQQQRQQERQLLLQQQLQWQQQQPSAAAQPPQPQLQYMGAAGTHNSQPYGNSSEGQPAATMYGSTGLQRGTENFFSVPNTYTSASRIQSVMEAPSPMPRLTMTLSAGHQSAGGALGGSLGLGLNHGGTVPSLPQRSMSGDGGSRGGGRLGLGLGGASPGAFVSNISINGSIGRMRVDSSFGPSMFDPDIVSLAGGGGGGGGGMPNPVDPLDALFRDLESPMTSFTGGPASLLGRTRPTESNPLRLFRRPRLPVEVLCPPVAPHVAPAMPPVPPAEDQLLYSSLGMPSPSPPLGIARPAPWGTWAPGLSTAGAGPNGPSGPGGPDGCTFANPSGCSSSTTQAGMYDMAARSLCVPKPPLGPATAATAAGTGSATLSQVLFRSASPGGGPPGNFIFAGETVFGDPANMLRSGAVGGAGMPFWTGSGVGAGAGASASAVAGVMATARGSVRPDARVHIAASAHASLPATCTEAFPPRAWVSGPQLQHQAEASATAAFSGAGTIPPTQSFPSAFSQGLGGG